MGAEVGATTSTFPYSANMRDYLHATGRRGVAEAADQAAKQGFLAADEGAQYDEVIAIVRLSLLFFTSRANQLTVMHRLLPRRTCRSSSPT